MFYLAGIIITFFLATLLFTKKGKTEADRILSVWLVIIGIHLSLFYLFISGKYVQIPYFLGFELGFPLLHGPFLYLYTRSLSGYGPIRYLNLIHFIPFLLTYLFLLTFILLPFDQKIRVYQQSGKGYESEQLIIQVATMISGIAYVTVSLLLLRKHRKRIENSFSNTDRINLNWLRYLIYGILFIWLVILSGLHDTYIFGSVVVYVFFMGYFGIRQVGIFTNPASTTSLENETLHSQKNSSGPNGEIQAEPSSVIESELPVSSEPAKTKYQKSALGTETASQIHQQLQRLMETEKPYQDPELTLANLSGRLGVHPNILSQVINSFEQKNFYEYINQYRIESFKQLIRRPEKQKYTLLSLAFECGFNSKTAFNRNFKKATGLSPSEYLSRQNMGTEELI